MTPDARPLVGDGAALAAVRRAVERVAPTDATVLLLGETGTGKELVARLVHDRSSRRAGPFVPVSCAALAPGLIASELFGHEAGAFTGAVKRRAGRFELAAGGTLFLDEVGELPPEAQAALLRVLQERVVERVGGGEPVPVDVRLVAATHRDLAAEVAAGQFRADLFYRLNVFPVAVPPLRDRPGDIPALVDHFVRHFAGKHGRSVTGTSAQTLAVLSRHPWPGNVRELQNVVERAVILSDGPGLAFDPGWLVGASASEGATTWAAQERARVLDALRAAGGRVYGPGGAAHRLGLKPTTLYGKMRKHGIGRDPAGWG
ncbi:MAG TPA: sigma 54-interacting transcriptional regulator [Urbifossiella sp.]|nr:sigma 54-interacting transcriptional regulator [Urbifossiella sp.]